MNFDEYQKLALRTSNLTSGTLRLAYLGLGLTGEAGEVVEHIKKHVGHGHDLNVDAVAKELGDVLWYVAVMADALGLTLEDVAARNIEKLRKRYPCGFSREASQNREDQ